MSEPMRINGKQVITQNDYIIVRKIEEEETEGGIIVDGPSDKKVSLCEITNTPKFMEGSSIQIGDQILVSSNRLVQVDASYSVTGYYMIQKQSIIGVLNQ